MQRRKACNIDHATFVPSIPSLTHIVDRNKVDQLRKGNDVISEVRMGTRCSVQILKGD